MPIGIPLIAAAAGSAGGGAGLGSLIPGILGGVGGLLGIGKAAGGSLFGSPGFGRAFEQSVQDVERFGGEFTGGLDRLIAEGFFDPRRRARLARESFGDPFDASLATRLGAGSRQAIGGSLGRSLGSLRADVLENAGPFGGFGARRGAEIGRRQLFGDAASALSASQDSSARAALGAGLQKSQAATGFAAQALQDRFGAERDRMGALLGLFGQSFGVRGAGALGRQQEQSQFANFLRQQASNVLFDRLKSGGDGLSALLKAGG